MKINKIKNTKKLTEAVQIQEPEKVLDNIDKETVEQPLDLEKASSKDLLADIATSANDENKALNVDAAKKVINDVEELVPFIDNPYGTSQLDLITKALQRSLRRSVKELEYGISSDGSYQNIILYGLAGFGKTSAVKQFCKDHGVYLFECDAKSLDIATVGGIPYPKQDKKTGEYKQAPIASSYWDSIDDNNYKYTIVFLDEFNRANSTIRGSLLDLINNHQIPAYIEDEHGRTKVRKTFKKMLFTVIAINPASDVFVDVEKLGSEVMSRAVPIIEVGPNKKSFYNLLDKLYTKILELNLPDDLRAEYEGQKNIMKALLTDPKFEFDDEDTVRTIFNDNKVWNYLNYRTFLGLLRRSDGTKEDYLDIIETESKLYPKDVQMIKSILATYRDKPTTGNNIFGNTNNTSKSSQVKSSIEAKNMLDAFADSLDDNDLI